MTSSVVRFGEDVDLPDGVTPAVTPTDADVAVAVGEAGLTAAAEAIVGKPGASDDGYPTADERRPIVPVGVPGVPGPDRDTLGTAIEAVVSGRWPTVAHPVLGVEMPDGGRPEIAALDATLVTGTPAAISAYEIVANGATRQLRADGVVIATPAGSTGYARAAGGPRLSPGTDSVAVVPIAPFAMDADRLVTPLGSVAVTVSGALGAELQIDGNPVADVATGETVRVGRAGTLQVARPPEAGAADAAAGGPQGPAGEQ
jgi:NAD+ kinase